MKALRKIPLENFIQILQDLYDGGADYIDISGEQSGEEESLKDIIKITVRPEYVNEDNDIEIEFTEETGNLPLSDDDINDLI
jgi:hypothetical protein